MRGIWPVGNINGISHVKKCPARKVLKFIFWILGIGTLKILNFISVVWVATQKAISSYSHTLLLGARSLQWVQNRKPVNEEHSATELMWLWSFPSLPIDNIWAMMTITTMAILRPFVRDYPGEPVPEETLTHPPSWSSSNLYLLLPSTMLESCNQYRSYNCGYWCQCKSGGSG